MAAETAAEASATPEGAGAWAVRAAADKAASAAAGKVLIDKISAIASVLHVQLGVSKERVKRLVLRWPRLLEVGCALCCVVLYCVALAHVVMYRFVWCCFVLCCCVLWCL